MNIDNNLFGYWKADEETRELSIIYKCIAFDDSKKNSDERKKMKINDVIENCKNNLEECTGFDKLNLDSIDSRKISR